MVEKGITTIAEAQKMAGGSLFPSRMLPTLTSRDWKDQGPNTNYQKAKEKSRLAGSVGGTLNPEWAEWFMGFPIGWTDVDID